MKRTEVAPLTDKTREKVQKLMAKKGLADAGMPDELIDKVRKPEVTAEARPFYQPVTKLEEASTGPLTLESMIYKNMFS